MDDVGLTFIVGGDRAADPRRARSGEARALWRHAAAIAGQGTRRQPLVPGRSGPRRGAGAHGRRGADAVGRSRHRAAAGDNPRRSSGLCARRRQGRPWSVAGRSTGSGTYPSTTRARGQPRPAISVAIAKRAGANAVVVSDRSARADIGARGPADPGRCRRHHHARLRRDRQREGQRTPVPSRPRHRLHRGPDCARDRLARGRGDARGHSDHDPADAVCGQHHGLHHQPRQPVRADLLDRHSGRRCDRRGGEHRAPLGDAGRPSAAAGRDRGRRRSRQSDDSSRR